MILLNLKVLLYVLLMKISSYEFNNNTLEIIFDKSFKQIIYSKIEPIVNDDINMEYDNTEIMYSKNKNNITIFTQSNYIIVLVTHIDNKQVQYAYRILNENNNKSVDLKTIDNLDLKIKCPIKNENIFANIKKK